ncbi:MAG: NAD(P)/FAD-dependent oxidoreductase [Erythrobacter sp.]
MSEQPLYDFAIVGGGMAGASLAAELAPHARVLVLEAEDAPGYHSTGRSAAFWDECYGGPEIVPLTLASLDYLEQQGVLAPRGAVYLAHQDNRGAIAAFMDRFGPTGARIERLDSAALAARVPHLREAWGCEAVAAPYCADIDVAGLHQHYLGLARRHGAQVACRARLARAHRAGGMWHLASESGAEWRAAVLVNAAGAWADAVAAMAGVRPLGIAPKRRCVAVLRVAPEAPADLPLTIDIAGSFYFKPDNGRLWLSPHDEVPSEPCDAAPEELDIAIAIDRFQQVTDWRIAAVERRWAGLRSFAPDRAPVYGADPAEPGFFWFAGQGGFGIQTAPAAARLAAQMLLGQGRDAMTARLDAALYAPARLNMGTEAISA